MSSHRPNTAGRTTCGAGDCAARVVVGAVLWVVATTGAAIAAETPAVGDFQQAADAFARRDWSAAVNGFEAYLAAARDCQPPTAPPQAAEAPFFRAESMVQLGQTAAARPYFQDYLARQPNGRLARAARFRAAEAAFLTKQDEAAVAELAEFLARHSGDALAAQAASMQAVSEARLGRWPAARAHYDALRRDHPGHAAVSAAAESLAAAALAGGQSQWAEQLYRQQASLAQTPAIKAAALLGVGRAQCQQDRWTEAAEAFAEAAALAPASPIAAEALIAQGNCLKRLGRYDPAMALFDEAAARDAGGSLRGEALLLAAIVRVQLRQFPAALACFERLSAAHPDIAQRADALDGAAETHMALGRPAEADRLWRRLCDTHTDSPLWPSAVLRVADRAAQRDQHAEAQKFLTRLVAAGAASEDSTASERSDAAARARVVRPKALALLGQAAAAQDQWDASQAAYERLLRDFPDGPWKPLAMFGVAEALFRRGDFSAAIDMLRPIGEDGASVSDAVVHAARLRRAQAHCHLGQWQEALAAAESTDRASLDDAMPCELDFVRGRCLAAMGQYAQAREAFAAVVRDPRAAPTLAAGAQQSLAETYVRQFSDDAALREYLRIEDMRGTETQRAAALWAAGQCCERLARFGRAAELYTRLATTYSQTPYAQEAIGRRGALGEPKPRR